jgi:hypothetical protein
MLESTGRTPLSTTEFFMNVLQEYGGFISRVDYQRSVTIAKWPYSGLTAKFAVGVPVKGADISVGYQVVLIIEEERISG